MRTLENSKVGIAEKADYLIIHTDKCSSCEETRMPSSTKSDDGDQFDADFIGDVEKLSSSPDLYNMIPYKEFIHISDKTIDFHTKNLLSDSGTECSLLADPEEEVTSLDSNNGSLSKETDPDSEGQDEGDSEDVEKETNDDASASQDGKGDAEDLGEDSCEMTYIELDLSSQSNKDVSDDETCMERMMKNLKISVHSSHCKFDSGEFSKDDQSDEEDAKDSNLEESAEKQGLNLHNEIKSSSSLCLTHSLEPKDTSSNQKQVKRSEFFGSFLPVTESRLCSLPERTYVEIAEHLLDEQTQLKLSDEEDNFLNSNPCRTTFNADDIPFVSSEMELSNQGLECPLTPDEADLTYKMYPMTYVELDITESCAEDLTHEMFSSLNINDDKSPLCRGNPSDQDEIQNNSLCSEIDQSDFEVPTLDIDNPSFIIDGANADLDFNPFTDLINRSSFQDFYSLPTSTELESPVCLPTLSNDCITKTSNMCHEINSFEEKPSEISFPKNSFLPSGATAASTSFQYADSHFGTNVSFFDDSSENDETNYENEFVTRNLPELKEISDILGLSNPESQNTIPSFSTPPALTPLSCSFTTATPPSVNSNVIPRVTTQTPGTQSDAIPALPGFLFILSTSLVQGMKRPSCYEMSEPAKKPFGFDSLNNSAFSEACHKKNAKQVVEKLTEKQLLEFVNNESCLHEAVRKTNYEYVLALLKRLAKIDSHSLDIINSKNEKSQTPLHLAVQKNIPSIVYLLIKYGAEVNHLAMTPSQKLEAPIHYVASRGIQFRLVLKCLLEAKDLDINIKNSEGQTALHCAALAHGTVVSNSAIDNEYIIKKLLGNGADPLVQDYSGKNVLMYAIESKEINLVSQIIKTVSRDHLQELLEATNTNEQTCLSLAHSLNNQYNQTQWEKLINMLTHHTSSSN